MAALLFHAVALAALVLAASALLPRWGLPHLGLARALAPAALLLFGAAAILGGQAPWVTVKHGPVELPLRFGVGHRDSVVFLPVGEPPTGRGWTTAPARYSASELAAADFGIFVAPGVDDAQPLAVRVVAPKEVELRSAGDLELYALGARVRPPARLTLAPRENALRWGKRQVSVDLVTPAALFALPLLLLAGLLAWAGLDGAPHRHAPLWLALLGVAAFGALVQARLALDLGVFRSFRAVLAGAAAAGAVVVVCAGEGNAGSRRLAGVCALAGGVVLAAHGRYVTGSTGGFELAVWLAVAVGAPLLAALWRLGRWPAPLPRWQGWAGSPWWPAAPMVALGLTMAGLARLQAPGRFVLLVPLLALWGAELVAVAAGRGSPRRAWGVLAAGVVPVLATDLGFGLVVAVAMIVSLAMALPPGRRWGVVVAVAGLALAAGLAFSVGLVPARAEGRIPALLNPVFAVGSPQLLLGRLGVQDGGLWGQAWGGPLSTRVPRAEDDFVATALAQQVGALGLVVLVGLLAVMAFGLWQMAGAADGPRRWQAWLGVAMSAFFLALIGVNLCGVSGLLPLTGVPIVLVSRSADAALALLATIAVISTRAAPGGDGVRRRAALPAAAPPPPGLLPFALLAAPAALGTGLLVATALAWRWAGDAEWHSFHEQPLVGTAAVVERVVGADGVGWRVQGSASGAVRVAGHPLSRRQAVPLEEGTPLRVGAMALELRPEPWNPHLAIAGWELAPADSPALIGRIDYSDRLWWARRTPAVHLAWDELADLGAAELLHREGGWLLSPAMRAYRGVQVAYGPAGPWAPLAAAAELPRAPERLYASFGRTVLAFAVGADETLWVGLVRPQQRLPLSKAGRNHLGGGWMARSLAFRQERFHDVRTQAAVRRLIEEEAATPSAAGLTLEEGRWRAPLAEVRLFQSWRYGRWGPIPNEDLVLLEDGRPAGLRRDVLSFRLAGPGGRLGPLELLDRSGRPLDAEALGLTPLVGTAGFGPSPGLQALASGLGRAAAERPRPPGALLPTAPGPATPPALRLHLDADVQAVAARALEQWGQELRRSARGRGQELRGSVLLLDQRNRILAMASTPVATSSGELAELLDRRRYDPRVEVGALQRVRSGSVTKLACWPFLLAQPSRYFTANGADLFFLAEPGRRSGRFVDRGSIDSYGGRSFRPVHNAQRAAYGVAPFTSHVAKSTNTSLVPALAGLDEAGLDELVEVGRALGVFRAFDLIPPELRDSAGPWERHLRWGARNVALEPLVPDPFGDLPGGRATARHIASRVRFHLGDLSTVSALHVGILLNTLTNEGVYVSPTLLAGIGALELAAPEPEIVLAPEVARLVVAALRGVVATGGTAGEAFRGSTLLEPRFELVGKTGTGERRRPAAGAGPGRRTVPDRSDKLFVGSFLPFGRKDSPRLTVVVYGERVGLGGPGEPALDALGAHRTARRIMEVIAGLQPIEELDV